VIPPHPELLNLDDPDESIINDDFFDLSPDPMQIDPSSATWNDKQTLDHIFKVLGELEDEDGDENDVYVALKENGLRNYKHIMRITEDFLHRMKIKKRPAPGEPRQYIQGQIAIPQFDKMMILDIVAFTLLLTTKYPLTMSKAVWQYKATKE
jgi:hypothetical protein